MILIYKIVDFNGLTFFFANERVALEAIKQAYQKYPEVTFKSTRRKETSELLVTISWQGATRSRYLRIETIRVAESVADTTAWEGQ